MNDLNNLLLRHQELRKYLSDVIKLEEAMSNITNLTSTGIDINKLKPFKVSQLAKEMPFLNWTAFFQSAFTSETLEDPTIVFDDIEVLIQVSTDSLSTQYDYTVLYRIHICILKLLYHMWAQRTPADAASLRALRGMMKAFFH